jgi:hypothetical protein
VSGGFGLGPYGYFPAGSALEAPAEEARSSLSSSRKVNGVTKRYVINDDGGFEAMNDIAQTVLLRICYADTESPYITPRAANETKAKVRAALKDMETSKLIRIEAIEVEEYNSTTTLKRIRFFDLTTQKYQTVEPS